MKLELNTHSKNIIRLAKEHPEVLVLSADLGSSCEISEFKKIFPDRYLSMGIAEQNMCSWAAGLAREGYRPFLHSFSVFLYRRILDQIEMSVAYPNLPVVFVGFVPGITTPGGVSHQSTNDIGVLRTIPNMAIIDIGDATEIEGALDLAYKYNGPVYIRMLRKEVPRLFPANEPIELNKARQLSEGTDVTVLSSSICTEEAIRAIKILKEKGVSVNHLHVSTLKPFTDQRVVEACKNNKYGVITIENGTVIGGLGTAVAEVMAENAIARPLRKIGLQDTYAHGASKMFLLNHYDMGTMRLVEEVESLMSSHLNIAEDDIEKIRFEDYSEV